MSNDFSTYLSGQKLYGDDFTIEEIRKWFVDESEGYADLGAKERQTYRYIYHQLNRQHAYRYLGDRSFDEALGIGSAYGEEFKPIAQKLKRITILDPSEAFSQVKKIFEIPCEYIKPNPSGTMLFKDEQFDLVTCFGVMHHIPNVSHVMSECNRCLKYGGIMLVREPIVSMGDWRESRRGLTKRERGIPLKIFDGIVSELGFEVKRRSFCYFPLVPNIGYKLGIEVFNSPLATKIDALLCKLFSWNLKYHRTKAYEKLSPASVFYVLEKKKRQV